MEEQLEFFTVANLATLAGAIAATKIVTTVICNYREGWSPKVVAGVVALLIQVFVWAAGAQAGVGADWVSLVVAILGAAVVYVGATGVNAMTAGRVEAQIVRGAARTPIGRGTRRWY